MAKRLFDIVFSVLVLLASAPVMLTALFLVWWQDRHSPLYKATRVARGNGDFVMIKIRSMRINADKTGVTSTSATDNRITRVGHFIRRFKLDELSQFWNVLMGDMSVVGPRPNTRAHGVDLYTPAEMHLLSVRPGITDLASIVFSDEGQILAGSDDADGLYNRIIRPWKSRLGLVYIANSSVLLDMLSGFGANVKYFRQTELQADLLSVYLLANAGYPPRAAIDFWNRFGPSKAGGIFRSRSHPHWRDRVATLEAEIAKLETVSARPMVPGVIAERSQPLSGDWQSLLIRHR